MAASQQGATDNAMWHMLPEQAQNAWRQYARAKGNHGRTSDAFAAGVWWAMQHYLKEAVALVEKKEGS